MSSYDKELDAATHTLALDSQLLSKGLDPQNPTVELQISNQADPLPSVNAIQVRKNTSGTR